MRGLVRPVSALKVRGPGFSGPARGPSGPLPSLIPSMVQFPLAPLPSLLCARPALVCSQLQRFRNSDQLDVIRIMRNLNEMHSWHSLAVSARSLCTLYLCLSCRSARHSNFSCCLHLIAFVCTLAEYADVRIECVTLFYFRGCEFDWLNE